MSFRGKACLEAAKVRLEKYHPVKIAADLSFLGQRERSALSHLVKASKLADQIYLSQVWSGNKQLAEELDAAPDSVKDVLKTFFHLCKGPWDAATVGHQEETAFIPNVPPTRPKYANFYPADLANGEFQQWSTGVKEATSFVHVIKRNEQGGLFAQPYSQAYNDLLVPLSESLDAAATDLQDSPACSSLVDFLRKRAKALLSNEYGESEVSWLKQGAYNNDLRSPFEVIIGPYEVYTDELFALKAAFQAFLFTYDFSGTEMVKHFTASLAEVEAALPIPDEVKQSVLKAPLIVVVNQIYAGGDVAVPMTAAMNLPNDEKILKENGSKLVLIKNVQQAKFQHVLKPIADLVIHPSQLQHVSFDAFFTHVLMHEVAHSNGPHFVHNPSHELNGRPVRQALQEHHSALEEAKADIVGLFAVPLMCELGRIQPQTKDTLTQFYVTFIASAFRTIRFGLEEAHGKGQAAQLSFLMEQNAVVVDPSTNTCLINVELMPEAVAKLTEQVLMLQAEGDKVKVNEWFARYGRLSVPVQGMMDKLNSPSANIPIDIHPIYDNEIY